jgi:methionine-rich copper-binding protein CopC
VTATTRRATAPLVLLLLVLAGLLLTAVRADAHNSLQSTDPADGSTVAVPPTHVTLTFDQPAQALGTEVVVLGPDGTTVSTGTPELVDSTVAQALVADLPAGAYTVQWRVTSADGHPLSGELTFTAEAGTAPEPTADATTPAPAADVAPTPAGTAEDVAPSPEATLTAGAETVEDDDTGLAAGVVVAIAVGVLAAAAVTAFVIHERRRSKDARTDG